MATADDDKRPGSFKVEVTAYRCRCGHEWASKGLNKERPRVCPKCKSANWDKEYRYRRKTD